MIGDDTSTQRYNVSDHELLMTIRVPVFFVFAVEGSGSTLGRAENRT